MQPVNREPISGQDSKQTSESWDHCHDDMINSHVGYMQIKSEVNKEGDIMRGALENMLNILYQLY